MEFSENLNYNISEIFGERRKKKEKKKQVGSLGEIDCDDWREGALEPPEKRKDCGLVNLSLYGEIMK